MKVITAVSAKRVLLGLLLSVLLPVIGSAQVTARLDRRTIGIDETVQLTIEADGARNTIADIDTSALEKNFTILSRSSNSSFSIINGSATVKKTWTFEIEAQHTGDFTIPPFVIGREKSNPLTLKVTDSAPATAVDPQNLKDVFIEVTPEIDTPAYLQEQLTISVKLFINSQMRISDASLEEPDIAHAIVQKLGDDHNYQVKRGDRTYQVIERKYAIMAEEGSSVTVPALRFQAIGLNYGNRHLMGGDPFFDRFTNPGKRIWAKSRKLEIALSPIPAEFHGRSWLPARALKIMEKEDVVKELKVGEPLTRVIQIEALGLTAEQLPEIKFKAPDGSKVYLDQPEMQTKIDNGDLLHAVKRQSLAFIPSQPGTFTLPAITIDWWDVVNNRQQQAALPERVIKVVAAGPQNPAAVSTAAGLKPAPPQTDKVKKTATEKKISPTSTGVVPQANGHSAKEIKLWQTISTILLLVWLITLGLWWRSRHRRPAQSRKAQPQTIRRPQASQEAIKQACLAHNPGATQAAILEWAAATWPENPPTNLKAIAHKLEQPGLEKILAGIEKALYSPTEQSAWDGAKIWSELADKLKERPQTVQKSTPDSLPPLYRQS